MTIDEAILHAEEVAEGYEEDISKWEYTLSEYRKRECVEQTTIPRCEKALNKCKQCASEHRQLAEWLKELKQLREQTTWIPVSERLPEKDKYTEFYECLVAVSYTSRHNVCKTVSAYFNGKHFYSNRFDRAFIPEVKAWMPIPESYKGE